MLTRAQQGESRELIAKLKADLIANDGLAIPAKDVLVLVELIEMLLDE